MPITAAIAATTSEATSVTPSALSARGLEIELHSVPRPEENALTTTAASGMRTIRLR